MEKSGISILIFGLLAMVVAAFLTGRSYESLDQMERDLKEIKRMISEPL
jgi:hypothetical protein